jgi:hypothetical protein
VSSQPPYGNDPSLYPSGGQSYPPQQPYPQPGYPEPGYPEPGYPPQPAYPQQNYPQQPYPQPSYPTNPGSQGGYMPPPPPPPYGAQPGYGAPPAYGGYAQPSVPLMAPGMPGMPGIPVGIAVAQPESNGLAVTSLVLGIVGAVFSLLGFTVVCGFLSFPLGVIGTILGALGARKTYHKGMAIAGLILSIVAVVITIGWFVLFAIVESSPARGQ